MHLERSGVILVGILEFDANGDVSRLKEADLKSRNGIIRLFFSQKQFKSCSVQQGADRRIEKTALDTKLWWEGWDG